MRGSRAPPVERLAYGGPRRAGELEETIKDTEELVTLGLDTQRNQILGVEMLITLLSTAFGLGAHPPPQRGTRLGDHSLAGTDAPAAHPAAAHAVG